MISGGISLTINKIASNSGKIMPTKTPEFIPGKFHNSICLVCIFKLNFIALQRIQPLEEQRCLITYRCSTITNHHTHTVLPDELSTLG